MVGVLVILWIFSTTSITSQIIGSSVVTSVSVISDHHKPTYAPVRINLNPDSNVHGQLLSRKDDNVQNMISKLKTIVRQENERQAHTTVKEEKEDETTSEPEMELVETTFMVPEEDEDASYSLPTTTIRERTGIIGDDEVEDNIALTMDAGATEAINDFATNVVRMPALNVPHGEAPGTESEEGATSAEVHNAIHKLSGAILSPQRDHEEDHIENILANVLNSINQSRNSSKASDKIISNGLRPKEPMSSLEEASALAMGKVKHKIGTKKHSSRPMKPTVKPTRVPMITTFDSHTTKKPMKAKVTQKSSTKAQMKTTPVPTSPKTKPPISYLGGAIIPMRKKNKPTTPSTTTTTTTTTKETSSHHFVDDIKNDFIMDNSNMPPKIPQVFSPLLQENGYDSIYLTERPISTTSTSNPLNYFLKNKMKNGSTSNKKPQEFYDDEIFGFDPYQTFFHGVYVPEHEAGSSLRPIPQYPQRPSGQTIPQQQSEKPLPMLPDYLHRPRPSHIQYQHGALEDIDGLGLLHPKFEHPGASYGPDTPAVSADKLLSIPRPPLPYDVRKNLTDHHDQHSLHLHGVAVHGHGHGHGHGHDHGNDDPATHGSHSQHNHHEEVEEKRPVFGPAPKGNPGLEATVTSVDPEMRAFVEMNNRIALRLLSSITNPISKAASHYGNMVISPFTIISSLSMLFLGARGATSAQLDGILRLDDMLTFNPHMMYKNVTQSFLSQSNTAAAIVRLLIADKNKHNILDFYKTRIKHFYDARVEEADYKFAGHMAQSIINQMIRAQIQKHSYEILNSSLQLEGPLSLLTGCYFDGHFLGSIKDDSIDHMNFIHLKALGRRLFEVPAISFRGHLRAAYDMELDATAVEIPYTTRDLSLLLIMPGKPGEFAIGGVDSLKSRLTLHAWNSLMRGFYVRDSFRVVFPRFRHHSSVNLSHTLQRFGLNNMFQKNQAKFEGINGLNDLFLDKNMMHFAEFSTLEKVGDTYDDSLFSSSNKNLELVRILRPHVKEHYGKYGEPFSITDWAIHKAKTSNIQTGRKSRPHVSNINEQTHFEAASILAAELARAEQKLKKAHAQNVAENSKSYTNPPSYYYPSNSYTRISHGKYAESSRDEFARKFKLRQSDANEPVKSSPNDNVVLRFERPFIYVLRHNPTGIILMTGQYTEPMTNVS